MLFTDSHLDSLEHEAVRLATLAAEFRVPITFPIAQNPEEYAQRPCLQFEENRTIRCQNNFGKLTKHRYNLLRRLTASRTGVVHVLELCERDETLQLAPLWKDHVVPVEGSLRNFASRINGDLAKYGMPWAVSYSNIHNSFILRFLPDPQAERKKYPRYLPATLFVQISFASRNAALSVLRPPDCSVLLNKPPFGHVPLE